MRGAECCSVCVPCPSRFPRVLVSSAAASTGHHGGRPLSVEAHGGRSHGLSPGSSQQAFGGHGRWSFPAHVRRPRPRGAQERVGSLALTRPLFLSQVLGTQPCSPSLRPPVGPLVAPPRRGAEGALPWLRTGTWATLLSLTTPSTPRPVVSLCPAHRCHPGPGHGHRPPGGGTRCPAVPLLPVVVPLTRFPPNGRSV